MKIVIVILSLIILIKTTSYGIYEIKNNENKFGGIFVITLAIISTILPIIVVNINGI